MSFITNLQQKYKIVAEVQPLDWEHSDHETYSIVALITNPHSHYYMEKFPGLDALQIDAKDKLLIDAITLALRAGKQGQNSPAWGSLQALIRWRLLSKDDVKKALFKWHISQQPKSE